MGQFKGYGWWFSIYRPNWQINGRIFKCLSVSSAQRCRFPKMRCNRFKSVGSSYSSALYVSYIDSPCFFFWIVCMVSILLMPFIVWLCFYCVYVSWFFFAAKKKSSFGTIKTWHELNWTREISIFVPCLFLAFASLNHLKPAEKTLWNCEHISHNSSFWV